MCVCVCMHARSAQGLSEWNLRLKKSLKPQELKVSQAQVALGPRPAPSSLCEYLLLTHYQGPAAFSAVEPGW